MPIPRAMKEKYIHCFPPFCILGPWKFRELSLKQKQSIKVQNIFLNLFFKRKLIFLLISFQNLSLMPTYIFTCPLYHIKFEYLNQSSTREDSVRDYIKILIIRNELIWFEILTKKIWNPKNLLSGRPNCNSEARAEATITGYNFLLGLLCL